MKDRSFKILTKKNAIIIIIIIIIIKFDEAIDHVIIACPTLAKEQYIKRHDSVCAQLHFNICKETEVQLNKKTLV